MAKAIIILANGFEEIEASSIIDILRRGRIDLTLAGLDNTNITGAFGLKVQTETTLSECLSQDYDIIILPGGEPGTTNLQNNGLVTQILKKQNQSNKYIAAICAAPRILDNLGLLNGKKATSYPGTRSAMNNCIYQDTAVVVEDNFITSRAPGTAMAFAYTILNLFKPELSKQLQQSMLFS